MTAVLNKKQLGWAKAAIQAAEAMEALLDAMESLEAEYPALGAIDAATLAENGDVQHVEVGDLATLVTRFGDLGAWFADQNRRDILRKVMKRG